MPIWPCCSATTPRRVSLLTPTCPCGLHMTKRKHAAKSATAATPSARSAKTFSPNLLCLDSSANPSAEKKAKISEHSNKSIVSEHIAGEDLGIDDIFQQARKKKQAPVKSEKVCALMFGKYKPALRNVVSNACVNSNAFFAQKPQAVSKAPRVVGSKDDLFGTGQPKQRRYQFASRCPSIRRVSSSACNGRA